MLGVVVRVTDVKLGSAGAVNPLIEESLHVQMIGFLDGFNEVGSHYVLAAIHLQIVMQSAIESVFANLVAKHVQNQAAFAVGVAVEFAGVVKVVAHDGLGVESARG